MVFKGRATGWRLGFDEAMMGLVPLSESPFSLPSPPCPPHAPTKMRSYVHTVRGHHLYLKGIRLAKNNAGILISDFQPLEL